MLEEPLLPGPAVMPPGGFPARNLLFFLQPSDSRSPGHPARDFAASSNAPTWKMPRPAPRAVLSLPEQGLSLPEQGCRTGTVMGMVPVSTAERSRLRRDPCAGTAGAAQAALLHPRADFITGANTAQLL